MSQLKCLEEAVNLVGRRGIVTHRGKVDDSLHALPFSKFRNRRLPPVVDAPKIEPKLLRVQDRTHLNSGRLIRRRVVGHNAIELGVLPKGALNAPVPTDQRS